MRKPLGTPAPAQRRACAAGATPRLLALAAYHFPHGDAMSNRLLQLARAATPPGSPTLVVNDWPDDGTRPPTTPELPTGVRLITLAGGRGGRIGRWLRRRTRAWRVLRALRADRVRAGDLDGVFLPLGLFDLGTWLVLRTVLRCPITVDVLERYDPAQFRRGRLAPQFLRHRWSFRLAGRLADRIIAITDSLGRHFTALGRPTLVVPPQVDTADYPAPTPPSLHGGLRLLYAGSAGAKDPLAVLVEGIRRLPPADRARVHLVIAGLDRERATLLSDLRPADLAELDGRVDFLGRVPRERVLAELGRSHFSVLVRPVAGYSTAGFPSKVPESLAAGCPVLLNHTSDLARYVVDGWQGIVLGGPTADDVRDGLARALALDDQRWWALSRGARERATTFDYRSWAPAVTRFVTGADPDADEPAGWPPVSAPAPRRSA